MEKPGLPSGTRDFGPLAMKQRKYVLNTMEKVFQLHGFQGIETPSLENLKTLQGKYGEEGDQLLFKVLNSGEYLKKIDSDHLNNKDYSNITPKIADRGLRYDLTVPLARFVVMNRNDIQFPFKRYQMQPVWRADRPQKGRYREFWQCDVDVVGSNSVVSEAELVEIYQEVFKKINLGIEIRVNHRSILDSFLGILGSTENWNSFMVAMDKYDKIGREGVIRELENRGLSHAIDAWDFICDTSELQSKEAIIKTLREYPLIQGESLDKGLKELELLYSLLGDTENVKFDLQLARGLSYYTGAVFEVVVTDSDLPEEFKIGSVGGGGRYDNLTSIFGLKDVSGVGVSFGLDRICDTLEASNKFPDFADLGGVIICCMDDEALQSGAEIARSLRALNFSVELYPSAVKLKKQLDFANQKGLNHAVILGSREIETKTASVKNLKTGEQVSANWADIQNFIK